MKSGGGEIFSIKFRQPKAGCMWDQTLWQTEESRRKKPSFFLVSLIRRLFDQEHKKNFSFFLAKKSERLKEERQGKKELLSHFFPTLPSLTKIITFHLCSFFLPFIFQLRLKIIQPFSPLPNSILLCAPLTEPEWSREHVREGSLRIWSISNPWNLEKVTHCHCHFELSLFHSRDVLLLFHSVCKNTK